MMSMSFSHIPPANGSYPVRFGNFVRPLTGGGSAAFKRICEAVKSARHSVWLTVAFLTSDFEFPDEYGSLFDLLDGATALGLDVRVIFWRPNPELAHYEPTVFSGTPSQRAMLKSRGSSFRARWDRAHGSYAQHSKSWLIDAGYDSEVAFVGGMNLSSRCLKPVGGTDSEPDHDLYLETIGPSATDIHHNFVQRWNEASERSHRDGLWGIGANEQLEFPSHTSQAVGNSAAQIQRTVHAGLYSSGHPSPDSQPYFIAGGEHSILEQYLRAIQAAKRTIYIENQALEILAIVRAISTALARGVMVTVLLPAMPEKRIAGMRANEAYRDLFAELGALGECDSFALVGIAGMRANGGRRPIYIHAKAMLVDDEWATVGSCNLHANSVFGSTEMNASFWDPKVVREFRVELLELHLARKTESMDDCAAFKLFHELARANARKGDAGEFDWQGRAFSLNPKNYGLGKGSE